MRLPREELRAAIGALASPEAAPPGATHWCLTPSPLGELLLLGDGERLTGLHLESAAQWPEKRADWRWDERPFRAVIAQLGEYFAGQRRHFAVPLAPRGTPFQQRVWAALQAIPFGATTSYSQLAAQLGDAKASRAVGLANGRNPIAIIIPCHRVIGARGDLTGYAGGIEVKRWLLQKEGVLLI